MELWIRSQSRTNLIKCNEIVTLKEDEIFRIWNKNCLLGEYKTIERALEVLDEIQYRLFLDKYDTIYEADGNKYYSQSINVDTTDTIVYEMPKE